MRLDPSPVILQPATQVPFFRPRGKENELPTDPTLLDAWPSDTVRSRSPDVSLLPEVAILYDLDPWLRKEPDRLQIGPKGTR